jgi:hypothetical protein
MKKFIIAMFVLTSSMVSAQAPVDPWSVASIALSVGQWISKDSKKVYYVQIEATANDPEQARQNGFRKAVELAVGTLVLGESESDGRRMIRNEVVTYSSGYVEDFKIISQSPVGNKTRIVMDVWVSDSKIANRLGAMGRNEGAKIDGASIKRDFDIDNARQMTEYERQRNGIKIMEKVLADYPNRAVQSEIKRTWVERGKDGIMNMTVETKIRFTKEYIGAMTEVIERTRQGSWPTQGKTGIKIYTGILSGTDGYYVDPSVQAMWYNTFNKQVSMKLTFTRSDTGKKWTNCWNDTSKLVDGQLFGWQSLGNGYSGANTTSYIVDGNQTVVANFVLNNNPKWAWSDDKFVNWVSKFDKVEAQLVDSASCP